MNLPDKDVRIITQREEKRSDYHEKKIMDAARDGSSLRWYVRYDDCIGG